MVGGGKALQRNDASAEQQGCVERPVMAAEHHPGCCAGGDRQRVAKRGERKTGMEQRADAEDRRGENAEEQRMLFRARRDKHGDHPAPQDARQERVANNAPILDIRVELSSRPARLAHAEDDEDGAGVAPHKDQWHARMAPEGKRQHDGVEEGMYRSERGQRMECLAAGCVDALAMPGGYIDLAEKSRLQISEAHALSHPETGQADRCEDNIGKTRSIDRQSGARNFTRCRPARPGAL